MTVGDCLHVSSKPEVIPSSSSMLSRDRRLPLETWNTSGSQENVFGNQFSTFDSSRNHYQGIQSDDVQRNREAAPEAGRTKNIHTSEDRLNQGTIPMPTFATTPSAELHSANVGILCGVAHETQRETESVPRT